VDSETIIAYVGLGSNLGDRAGNLLLAVRGLMEAGFAVQKLSAIYETEPVGVSPEHDRYLNMAAEIHLSGITPTQMMARMLRIEYLLGRKDKFLQKPRSVDLDLLLFDGIAENTELVTIPHPQMHERRFVLVPLAEIAPHAMHPVLHRSIADLLAEVQDRSTVHRWSPNVDVQFNDSEMNLVLKTMT
jgi:2-amino-4-hydroxy-6-hydroxymethyldihydropteridine diphosphokinase